MRGLLGPLARAEERSQIPGKAKLFEAMDGRVVWRPVDGEHCRGPGGQGRSEGNRLGGLLFGYFLLATQEKVTRSPKGSESSGFT